VNSGHASANPKPFMNLHPKINNPPTALHLAVIHTLTSSKKDTQFTGKASNGSRQINHTSSPLYSRPNQSKTARSN
jgi:hypothetical protein